MGENDISIEAVLVLGKDTIQVVGSHSFFAGYFLPWALRGITAPRTYS